MLFRSAKDAEAAAPVPNADTSAAAPGEPDAPSPDDPDVDDSSGVDLAMKAFGATQIGEIEH